jgi:Kef-type K+ transport system membrane component KefB
MVVGRLLGEGMNRIGQPSVMGMLLAASCSARRCWGPPPRPAARDLPEDASGRPCSTASRNSAFFFFCCSPGWRPTSAGAQGRRAALAISLTGVAVPFACGFALGWFLPEACCRIPTSAAHLALPRHRALDLLDQDRGSGRARDGLHRRNLGQIIVASAICEDSIGWVIIAITLSLAEAGSIDVVSVAKSVIGTAVFLGLSFTVGRRLVFF